MTKIIAEVARATLQGERMDLHKLRRQIDTGDSIPVTLWNELAILANRGNPEAAFLMGYRWFLRYGAVSNKASKWLKKAALAGHAEALQCLRTLCDEEELREKAAAGHVDAQMRLAHNLACGEQGFFEDLVEARYWFDRAATGGHAGAQFELGLMWWKGEGGPADRGRWLSLAAQAGHDTAPEVLALMEAEVSDH